MSFKLRCVEQAPLHKEFLNAVKKGELRVVHVLLKAGVLTNVNYQDEVSNIPKQTARLGPP